MKIFFVSNFCSDEMFNNIYQNSQVKPSTYQVQKFHKLLYEGLLHHNNEITVLSKPPINKSTNTTNLPYNEVKNNAQFFYLFGAKIAFINYLKVITKSFFLTSKWIKANKDSKKVIISDVLNLSVGVGAFLAAKIHKVEILGIVLDVPNYIQDYTTKKNGRIHNFKIFLYKLIVNRKIEQYDKYVFLTEPMNTLLNPFKRPYTIIEGISDVKMDNVQNKLEHKETEKVVMYAGALREKYGVKKLIEAFMNLNMKNTKLWLFGSGELEEEIQFYKKKDSRIHYFGNVLNEDVIKHQLKATVLVNPRPSNEEFTKFSFPSKNMESMASGTPLITTQLPGMPSEYNQYVYIFNDETVEGMTRTLERVLNENSQALHSKGKSAKEFVVGYKNNYVQARKILDIVDGY